MSEITARVGKVVIPGDGYDDELTPSEARAYAANLLGIAAEADGQLAEIRAACAGGHDWKGGQNLDHGNKRTVYYCKREGCTERREEPGWLPFEPKVHQVPIGGYPQPRDCTGPGCYWCDREHLGQDIQGLLSEAKERLAASPFNPMIFARDVPNAQG